MKSMNLYIDQVVTEALMFENDIESLFYDIAMEEEVAKDNTQASKEEPGILDKMIKTVKELFAQLNGMIQKNFLKFKNFLTRVAQSDSGFDDNFKKAFKEKKPMEAIKLITYEYNPELLDTEMKKINAILIKLFGNMANKTSYTALSDANMVNDMDRTPEELYTIIFKHLNCPSDVKDLSTYFLYIKNKYRVNKKETLFKSSRTQEYYEITKSHNKLTKEIQKSQTIIANQVGALKSNLHNTILNKQARPEVKKRALKQCKNLTHLFNFYIHFVDIYMQLQLERLFTYRTVLQKLYGFQ